MSWPRGVGLFGLLAVGCSSSSSSHAGPDASPDAESHAEAGDGSSGRSHDAAHDVSREASRDAAHDTRREATHDAAPDAAVDAPVNTATTALFRLANESPDAPTLDVCVSPHASLTWGSPLLVATFGRGSLGRLVVKDAPVNDAGKTSLHDAGLADTGSASDAAARSGLAFPRVSPYLAVAPATYDVRIVRAGAADCTAPLFPEVDDLPPLTAGVVATLVVVGDSVIAGADPPLSLVYLADDTAAVPSKAEVRFVNAVPAVASVTLATGTAHAATLKPLFTGSQFGGAGVDSDAGALDSNDYLSLEPVASQTLSLLDANGGATLLVVAGASLPAATLATLVAVGGETGATSADIGLLVCTDSPPIVEGDEASCVLLQSPMAPVVP